MNLSEIRRISGGGIRGIRHNYVEEQAASHADGSHSPVAGGAVTDDRNAGLRQWDSRFAKKLRKRRVRAEGELKKGAGSSAKTTELRAIFTNSCCLSRSLWCVCSRPCACGQPCVR